MGRSESDIKKLCPNDKVEKGLPIRGGIVKSAEKETAFIIDNIIKDVRTTAKAKSGPPLKGVACTSPRRAEYLPAPK